MIRKWRKIESKELFDFTIFKMRQTTSRSPRNGKDFSFYILDSPDWINVIPITPEGQVVLIEQFRHGTEENTLEIPGGMMDPGDNDPAESAKRELLEETGYDSDPLIQIGVVAPNPAILNNKCYTFIAPNARKVAEQSQDGAEDIAVRLVDVLEMPEYIADGRISHALVIAAFYHYENFRKKRLFP